MGVSEVYKRRRAHVMRENPKFFDVKENGAPRRRDSVSEEYDRLTAVSEYNRNPKAGTERPEGGVIPTTPKLKATETITLPLKKNQVGMLDADLDVAAPQTSKQHQRDAATKSKRPALRDLVLSPLEETHSESAKYLSVHAPSPNMPNFDLTEAKDNSGPVAVYSGIEHSGAEGCSHQDSSTPKLATRAMDTIDSESLATSNFSPPSGRSIDTSLTSCGGWGSGDGELDGHGTVEVWNTIQNHRSNRGGRISTAANETTNSRGCFNCGQEGHRKNECPEPPKAGGRACHTCGEHGHIARECPSDISAGDGRDCHNCGKEGHIARECPTGAGGGAGRACHSCGEQGHISRECPLASEGGRHRGCFTCGERGHRAAECPLSGDSGGHAGRSAGYGGVRGRTCFNCGQVGHISRECPDTNGGGRHDHGYRGKYGHSTRGEMFPAYAEPEPGSELDENGIAW